MTVYVITIDGPAGVGKSTVTRYLSRWLNYHVLISGSLYRTLAWLALQKGITDCDIEKLRQLIPDLNLQFIALEDTIQIRQDDQDISLELQTEECADYASRIAGMPELRTGLLQYQHSFQVLPGLIADGRDMGTVVFPDAQTKIFLTASLEERARRRSKQLSNSGFDGSMNNLISQMAERDRRDSEREHSPLKPAGGAVIINTTHKTAEQAAAEIINLLPRA